MCRACLPHGECGNHGRRSKSQFFLHYVGPKDCTLVAAQHLTFAEIFSTQQCSGINFLKPRNNQYSGSGERTQLLRAAFNFLKDQSSDSQHPLQVAHKCINNPSSRAGLAALAPRCQYSHTHINLHIHINQT